MAMRIALMKNLAVLFTLYLATRSLAAQGKGATCFRYGPDTVGVTGTLNRHIYYGAAGYGEDPKRDEKEVGFYLDLDAPACTVAGSDDIDVARKNIRRIQLVLDQRGYDALRPYLGQKVTLRGTLFGAITGHYHTPVLLDVLQPVRIESRY